MRQRGNGWVAKVKGSTFWTGEIKGNGPRVDPWQTVGNKVSRPSSANSQSNSLDNVPVSHKHSSGYDTYNANLFGDFDIALDHWNKIRLEYGLPSSKDFPGGFSTTLKDGTIVKGQFFHGGNTNSTGYNIKVKVIPPFSGKGPHIHFRYK